LRLLRLPHSVTDIAFLIGVGVFAIGASQVDLDSRNEGMFPDLVAAGLPINTPASVAQIAT
jgi:hypothetical protein